MIDGWGFKLTVAPGFWLLRAAIAVAGSVGLGFCWKWIRPRGKTNTSPAFRVVAKSVSDKDKRGNQYSLAKTTPLFVLGSRTKSSRSRKDGEGPSAFLRTIIARVPARGRAGENEGFSAETHCWCSR
jgi:hypothetical protein